MRRQRPKLFLKGRSARTRRRLLVVFLSLFAAPAASRPASAECVPFAPPAAIGDPVEEVNDTVTADLDGDGDLDVLTASSSPDLLLWHENDGTGAGWTRRTIAAAEGGANSIDTADLDGDGDLDVIFAQTQSDLVVWYEGAGSTGSLWSVHTIATSLGLGRAARAADADGDGDLDVFVSVSSSSPHDLSLFRNQGGGASWTKVVLQTSSGITAIHPVDLDRDGDIDLLTADDDANLLSWHRNNGLFWQRITIHAGIDVRDLAAADIDRDGDLDVASVVFDDGFVIWHENLADQFTWTVHEVGNQDWPRTVQIADFDGDGDPDVVTSSIEDDLVRWYENLGEGSWTPHTISTAASPFGIAVADLDRDGDQDLLSGFYSGDLLAWFRNRRAHGTALFSAAMTAAPIFEPIELEHTDVDGDGDLDLVVGSELSPRISWLENRAAGWSLHTIATGVGQAIALAVGDVDRDGDVDAISAPADGAVLAWYRNDGTPVGDSKWFELDVTTLSQSIADVVAVDLDRDGDLDLVTAEPVDGRIAWYQNDGTPHIDTWTGHDVYTLAPGAFALAVADLDGDGDLDIASVSNSGDSIRWHASDGTPANGGWQTSLVSDDSDQPKAVIAGDFDRDGNLDLAAASSNDDTIVLFRNTAGTGATWQRVTLSTTAEFVLSLSAADIDGDGDLDLGAAHGGENQAAWYENGSSGTAWAERILATQGQGHYSLALADLDGDGTVDAAYAAFLTASIHVVPNPGTLVFAEGQETNEGTACWSDAAP